MIVVAAMVAGAVIMLVGVVFGVVIADKTSSKEEQ